MAGDASAYAALGLEPGVDSATIEEAYKRLIKQHHPDREGGDAERAAEINRAYRELRAARSLKDPLELNDDLPVPPRQGGFWVTAAMIAVLSIGVLLLRQTPVGDAARAGGALAPFDHPKTASGGTDPMDQPLHIAAIDGAVQEAVTIQRTQDEMALAKTSQDCHHLLRTDPSLLQLDRCTAFDDAVVQLQDRDPLRDQGPFSEIAVTGRVWSGATALSEDSVAIDGRLDRIRLRVEVAIAPIVRPEPAAIMHSSSAGERVGRGN
jgi:hypothetical protein